MRASNRRPDQLRPIIIERGVNKHAEGSALIRCGDTHVLCTASVDEKLPPFLRGKNQGWVTAEYGMLPRATHERTVREAAAISGGFVALADAIRTLIQRGKLKQNPLHGQIAAVSVGIYRGTPLLDLEYSEDSEAETDMNIVMNDGGGFIEVQGTAEGHAFRPEEMQAMMQLAQQGIREIMDIQKQALGL